MKTVRVFPRKTSMSPTDKDAYFELPDLFTPKYDEVHISVTFTWDKVKAEWLAKQWKNYGKVKIGGPAYCSSAGEFTPGLYTKRGVTITTRGCNFRCSFCLVDKIEGKFREINIEPGNIIQDNNILLASRNHLNKVFQMLRGQKQIQFKGGLDKRLLKDWHIEELRDLRIKELWFAFDSWDNKKKFMKISQKLIKAGFTRNQLRCYVLAGFNEPIQASENRLRFVYECGALPFIQVYQSPNSEKRVAGERSREDNLYVRRWSRPAIVKSMMTERCCYTG